jgi:predicted ester cyclase
VVWKLIQPQSVVLCFIHKTWGTKLAYETLAHRWFDEVWNQGLESTIDELMSEDLVVEGLTDPEGNKVRGPASFKSLFRLFRTAFPDIHITVEDTLVDGDRIFSRCRVTGSHTGAGITAAPTNKTVDFTGMSLVRVKDGKVIEAWNNFDFLSMYQQLGMQLQ